MISSNTSAKRRKKILYLCAPILLILGCWISATLFGGVLNPGTLATLAIAAILISTLLSPITHRVSANVWISIGFFILVALFLPPTILLKFFPPGDAEPFSSSIAFTELLIISAAILVAALLINSGLASSQQRHSLDLNVGEGSKVQAWLGVMTCLLLLTRALYRFYWFMIWDSTTDPLGIIWLSIAVLVVIFSSFILFFSRSSRVKIIAFLYFLLIPALMGIAVWTRMFDFRHLTEERAEHISQAIESFYAQTGRYPDELRQLTPWYLLSIPEPVIIFGQDWCYDGNMDYYRLGYIYRQHWSDPRLMGMVFKTGGQLPALLPMCEAEVFALQKRYPDYPYEFWVEGD